VALTVEFNQGGVAYLWAVAAWQQRKLSGQTVLSGLLSPSYSDIMFEHESHDDGSKRTCVLISRTSLNVMLVDMSLLWSSVTTFALCSSTCFPPAVLPACCAFTCACRLANCLLMFAMSCFIMKVSSCIQICECN
jgi:hypothetical protein